MDIRKRIKESLESLIRQVETDRPVDLSVRDVGKYLPLGCKAVFGRVRKVQLANTKQAKSLLMHVKLMVIVNELLSSGKMATKREIYYQNERFFGTQTHLDTALDRLARTFQVPRDDLAIVAGSKGLVFGPSLGLDGDVSVAKPTCIPTDIGQITISDSRFILVVEKEAIFNSVVQDYTYLSGLLGPFILVTGKGYPCMATRRLVARIPDTIPAYGLVDYDPYGLEIAHMYRVGSEALPSDAHLLACPRLQYIGVTFGDIDRYGAGKAHGRLTEPERKRAALLKGKAAALAWPEMVESACKMLDKDFKAEIEEIPSAQHFFTRTFLLEKLCRHLI